MKKQLIGFLIVTYLTPREAIVALDKGLSLERKLHN